MSKIGKNPIEIPKEVEVKQIDHELKVLGPKGLTFQKINPEIKVDIKRGKILVSLKRDYSSSPKKIKSLWGLYRTLINNAVIGVSKGFEKKLEIRGVGYKAKVQNDELVLNLGFSHPVKMKTPEGIDFSVDKNIIAVSGVDKEKVGRIAAKIRDIRSVEPYKGKGVRYLGEQVKRKEGKKAITAEGV